MMKRFGIYLPLLLVVAASLIFLAVGPSRLSMDLIVTTLIFATFATGWNIAGGMAGLFSLGHGALFAIGAFGTTLLRLNAGVPTPVAILASALLAVLVALFIGAMSLRLRGHYFALATLGLSVIAYILLQNVSDVTGGDEGISIPFSKNPTDVIFGNKASYVIAALVLYAVTVVTVIILSRSKLGFQMLAVKQDEISARSIGIPAVRVKLFAVGLSGFFSALAGALFAQYTLYITPANVGSVEVSWQPALMAIIGGMLGPYGPLLGAVLITFLEHFVVDAFGATVPGLSSLVYGSLLVVSILVLPNGILGLLRRAWARPRQKRSQEPAPAAAAPEREKETVQ